MSVRIVSPIRRFRRLLAVAASVLALVGAGFVSASAAHADPTVSVLSGGASAFWAPYSSSSQYAAGFAAGHTFTISCYAYGQSESGPYGSENIWDMISGGDGAPGTFVPDAQVYTGSSSPVVPQCSSVLGQTIGSSPVTMRSGPGTGYANWGPLGTGLYVEINCYTTGDYVSGPYGSENVWDLLTVGDWVPDALVYTGSNSAVARHC